MTNYRCDQAIILLFHFRILNTYNAMYIKKQQHGHNFCPFFVHIVTLSYLIKGKLFQY